MPHTRLGFQRKSIENLTAIQQWPDQQWLGEIGAIAAIYIAALETQMLLVDCSGWHGNSLAQEWKEMKRMESVVCGNIWLYTCICLIQFTV